MKKNFTGEDKLLHDLNQLAAHTNEGGYKTRAAYKSHMRNFIRFYWREYHGQKLSNIEGKHIRAYAEYMKAQGLSPTTIKSRLSGIRFYQRKAGGKKTLPDNKTLGLEKRKVGRVDRAWTFAEVKAGMELAKNMGRMDVHICIGIGYTFGLRIEEICRVRAEDVEKALANDGLRVKGKGGQVRYVPIETEVQKKFLQYLHRYARYNHLHPGDYIISRNEKGGVERQINSLENWMYANRDKFTAKNRQDEIRDGKKPRSATLTWHGLRYKRAQEQYAKYEDEGRKDPKRMTSEILGHHRSDVTNTYLPELSPKQKKK